MSRTGLSLAVFQVGQEGKPDLGQDGNSPLLGGVGAFIDCSLRMDGSGRTLSASPPFSVQSAPPWPNQSRFERANEVKVRYVSTRGGVAPCWLRGGLFAGLAADGGLYLPERWPRLERDELAALQGASYQEVAARRPGAVRRR